ncbi:MAG: heavy metal translocating P-type ATPase [Rhizobacter sp.]|nr:heavy metal translocating P-type ATPase [Rhizobacter sp.]
MTQPKPPASGCSDDSCCGPIQLTTPARARQPSRAMASAALDGPGEATASASLRTSAIGGVRAEHDGHGHGHGHHHGHDHSRPPHAEHATTEAAAQAPQAGHAHSGHDHAGHVHAHDDPADGDDHAGHDHDHGAMPGPWRLAVSLVLALGAEAMSYLGQPGTTTTVIDLALALVAIGLAGIGVYKEGLTALRRGRLNINALMTVAVTGALVIGQWPEAAMVMALYAFAELIEERSVGRARSAIQGLLAMTPQQAEVQQADGRWLSMPAEQVTIGAIARVKPGERVPLDGAITAGRGTLDQSSVTGESMPVDKTVGDALFAGTINQTAALEFRVTAVAADSTLARIIEAVERAQASRAPTQRFIDRFASIYTPGVFFVALAVALAGPYVFGWTWLVAIYKALVLLVIACPCALVISTPVTVVSALAFAARRGVLVKGGVFLEAARGLKVVAFDKTGTLTEGRPKLVAKEVVSADAAVLRWAATLAGRSDHPVSQAIARDLGGEHGEVDGFEAVAGRGVRGGVDGRPLVLGNARMVEERGWATPSQLAALLAAHEQAGRTVTLLANESGVLAVFAVADAIKPTSLEAVQALKKLGIQTVMLSGDNAATARAIGTQAGIDDVHGHLMPTDKLERIASLQARHGPTAMAGDGINDAPALAQADIGIAMGGAGTDIATEAADVVVMNDDLRRLPELIVLSRRTHAVLWQNITLALGIKGVFLLLALFGQATMWMAVFADMGASLLVVANGLRLLRTKVPSGG